MTATFFGRSFRWRVVRPDRAFWLALMLSRHRMAAAVSLISRQLWRAQPRSLNRLYAPVLPVLLRGGDRVGQAANTVDADALAL